MKIGMEHVGICAKDTMALKDWYVKVFNFEVVYDNKKNPPTFFLKLSDNSMIEIYSADEEGQFGSNKVQGIRHIALSVENFEEEYKSLLDNGVEIIEEAKTSGSGVKTAFFKDIEGNILHFISRPAPLI